MDVGTTGGRGFTIKARSLWGGSRPSGLRNTQWAPFQAGRNTQRRGIAEAQQVDQSRAPGHKREKCSDTSGGGDRRKQVESAEEMNA